MDGFFDHIARFGLTEPNVSDFFAFGSLGHGAKGLGNLRAGLAIFDGGDPSLVFVDEAQTQTAAKEQHKGTSSKGRLHYARCVSVAPADLPAEWQAVPAAMKVRREAGDTRAPSLYIQDRMTQKLGQYILVMRREGLPNEMHQDGLTTFYADLSTRLSRHSGEPLCPATLCATWEELHRFARYRGTYSDDLVTGLKQTLKTLREEEANSAQLKFGKLHGIGSPPDVTRDALDMLDTAERAATPGKRHILRNRAAAFALSAILRSAGNGIGSCSAKRCFGRTIATISGVRGYGDFAIANDTGGDIVFTANFKSARRLIEHWKAFKHARQRIIDRCHATRIAEV